MVHQVEDRLGLMIESGHRRSHNGPHFGQRHHGAQVTQVERHFAHHEDQAPPLVPTVTVTVVDETPSAVPAPAVDDAAEISQSLLDSQWTADAETGPVMFDACDPRVEGDAATAVCRAARGTWNVTLRKIGAGWKVETARAER